MFVQDVKNPWHSQHLKLDAHPYAADFANAVGSRNQKIRLLEGLLMVCLAGAAPVVHISA